MDARSPDQGVDPCARRCRFAAGVVSIQRGPFVLTARPLQAQLQNAVRRKGADMFAAYKRFFDFKGRGSRSEYWLFFLCVFLQAVIALVIDRLVFGADMASPTGMYGPAYALVVFGNLIPGLSAGFRRLHDTNRSAWWMLIGLIPILGGLVLLVFYCLPGTPGPNRFGPQPGKAAEDLQATFS
jgi:uncharacterized membrane protein YhaH (DUF805 family)